VVIFRKTLVYACFLVFGSVAGLFPVDSITYSSMTFDGIPAERLTLAQIDRISRSTPVVIEHRTSLVVGGKPLLTADGGWLMWLVLLVPIVAAWVLASVLNRRLFRGSSG
jgi:hypothetical protein